MYWDCIWCDVCGKRIFVSLGNINEFDGICRIGTISGRELFCPGGIISSCYFHDVDGEYPACVLWDLPFRAVSQYG